MLWKEPLSIGSPSATLLIGKERFLKREFILTQRRRLFPDESGPGLNFQEFTVGEDPLHTVLDFLSTAPFVADHRMAVLWGVDLLEEEEQASLLAYLEKLPASSVCVLESEQTNAKKDPFLRQLADPFQPGRQGSGGAQLRARRG